MCWVLGGHWKSPVDPISYWWAMDPTGGLLGPNGGLLGRTAELLDSTARVLGTAARPLDTNAESLGRTTAIGLTFGIIYSSLLQ